MNYKLVNATEKDIDTLINNKLDTILEYVEASNNQEVEEVKKYVYSCFPKYLEYYKNILIDNEYVGSYSIIHKEDGYLLDEIYIKDKYRNKGIGTEILKNILNNYSCVYLWVYKNNTKAFNLYKKLGFKILDETEYRYYMEYKK